MIKVVNLSFTYSKKQSNTLKNISFKVNKGEIFGLLGPSGAGKSTLQKILLGLLREYEGEVKVKDREIKNIKRNFYDKIGVGFELPNLYEQLTIFQNLNTFSKLYSNQGNIDNLLKSVMLYEHKHKKVNEISKGMKMRLNFIRSLIGNPEIIFLDEPTSGLDPNNIKIIQDMIKLEKEKGNTIILTTHNMAFAEHICDKVAFIVDGEIKEMGTPKELKSKYGDKKVVVKSNDKYYEFNIDNLRYNQEFLEVLNNSIELIETNQENLEEIFGVVTGRVLV